MAKITSKKDISDLFYKINLERENLFQTKEKWLEPNRKTIERISKVVNEFIKKGWRAPIVRHKTKKHEVLGKYLAEGSISAFIEKWNSMVSWTRISDITFNPTSKAPYFAGFSIDCYYCLLTPYEYIQNKKLGDKVWKRQISEVGERIGWIHGAPLLFIKREKQNKMSITNFINTIEQLRKIHGFCDYNEIEEFFLHMRQDPEWHFF